MILLEKRNTAMTLNDCKLSVLLLLLLGFAYRQVAGVCDVDFCTNPTKCILSEDKNSCKCVQGFYDDHCDKDAHMRVLCTKDFMGLRATEAFFLYYNAPVTSLHLPNPECGAAREVIDDVPYYMVKVTKDQYMNCGGKPLEKNFTHAIYTMSLQTEPRSTGNIIRNPVIKLDFTCIFPVVTSISLPFEVIPIISEAMVRVDSLEAIIQMKLYTDYSYTQPFTSAPTIELGAKVFVEVTVTEPADFFLLRINDCWASQSRQANDSVGLEHSLLSNGCVNDNTVSFHNLSEEQLGLNGQSTTLHYSFEMFRFTAAPHEFYLHCTVQLCDPDDAESCKPNCNSISKREALRADPPQGLLSYGPIRIETPRKPASSVLWTVVLPVAGVWTVGGFLTLVIAMARAGSRKHAQTQDLQAAA
uniref:zona pellucida glycoprotein d n=1 Tax=Doryrhamphus excisus TaxID=161450 RepID=UPI0025AEC525|nr:zona pellucida glycoprotein d [Doryrhamphus excisus]